MILGVDIGGTKTRFVLYDRHDFKVLGKIRSSRENIEWISGKIDKLVESYNIDVVGIGIAGWVKDGIVLKTPNIKTKNDNIGFNLTVPYVLENDANCFAYGVYNLLAKKDINKIRNIVGITVGTGIGCGIIINGKIYNGRGLAGELAHITVGGRKNCSCGGKGHLESYFSGWALERQFKRPVKDIMEGLAKEFYELPGFDTFIKGVSNLVTILNPDAIIFSGGIGMNFDKDIVEARLKDYILPEFDTEVMILKDEYIVAKGSAFLAEETIAPKDRDD